MPVTPVSAETDISNGPTAHTLLVTFLPDLWDCSAAMNHAPGSWVGRHSLTSNVKFNDRLIVLDGHDQGPLLNHLPIADPYRSLKSNRKNNYSASQVKANKKPMACIDNGGFTLMACGDPVSLPTAINCTNEAHNLFIGMSKLDELKGDAAIVMSIATDLIMFAVSLAGGPATMAAGDVLRDFLGVDLKKSAVSTSLNLVSSIIISASTDWQEPITLKGETGSSYCGITHEVSYSPSTGAWEHKGSSNLIGRGKNEYGGEIDRPAGPAADAGSGWGEKL